MTSESPRASYSEAEEDFNFDDLSSLEYGTSQTGEFDVLHRDRKPAAAMFTTLTRA